MTGKSRKAGHAWMSWSSDRRPRRGAGAALAGAVVVDTTVDKPGTRCDSTPRSGAQGHAEVPPYVSQSAPSPGVLDAFSSLSVMGRVATDVGASTGGFTDCLSRRAAAGTVDVGYGQMAWKLAHTGSACSIARTSAPSNRRGCPSRARRSRTAPSSRCAVLEPLPDFSRRVPTWSPPCSCSSRWVQRVWGRGHRETRAARARPA